MRLAEHPAAHEDHRRARDLRNKATTEEKKLWLALRQQAAPRNLKFRRQVVIHPFIADFGCISARLLIEIDGYSHDVRSTYDKIREDKLKQMGCSVLRFCNEDINQNLDSVVTVILDQSETRAQKRQGMCKIDVPTPYPLPQGEGESIDFRGF